MNAEHNTSRCYRYTLSHEDGSKYDVVMVFLNGYGIGVKVDPGAKVLIINNGKTYSEQEIDELDHQEPDPKPTFKITETKADMDKFYPQYAKEYGGVLEFTGAVK